MIVFEVQKCLIRHMKNVDFMFLTLITQVLKYRQLYIIVLQSNINEQEQWKLNRDTELYENHNTKHLRVLNVKPNLNKVHS